MEKLPKDVKLEIALKLSPPDIVRFCLTESKTNRDICNSNDFWRRKLMKDYPSENIKDEFPKLLYIKNFTFISRKIEDFVESFLTRFFPTFTQFLNEEYKKELYQAMYNIYENLEREYVNLLKEEDRIKKLDKLKGKLAQKYLARYLPEEILLYRHDGNLLFIRTFLNELIDFVSK